jgi:DNA-binding MarR family transcriptional regulator
MDTEGPAADSVQSGSVPAHTENSVGFTLSQLGFETAGRFAQLVGGLGLEPRHFALLRAISETGGQSQQSLGERLAIPPSTMVAIVDHLESTGLVERHHHPSDRRTRSLHLTDAGTSLLAEAMASAMVLEATICAGLTPSERDQLLTLLRRVAANLDVPTHAVPDHGSGEHPSRT